MQDPRHQLTLRLKAALEAKYADKAAAIQHQLYMLDEAAAEAEHRDLAKTFEEHDLNMRIRELF